MSRRKLPPPSRPVWAPEGWVASQIGAWLQRGDGLEVYVRCDLRNAGDVAALFVTPFDEPAITRFAGHADFPSEHGAALDARTGADAVAEVDRRWPRAPEGT